MIDREVLSIACPSISAWCEMKFRCVLCALSVESGHFVSCVLQGSKRSLEVIQELESSSEDVAMDDSYDRFVASTLDMALEERLVT